MSFVQYKMATQAKENYVITLEDYADAFNKGWIDRSTNVWSIAKCLENLDKLWDKFETASGYMCQEEISRMKLRKKLSG